jgi:Zn-dependent protease
MENFDTTHVLQALLKLGVLVFSLSLHEFGHAFAATRLGDPTAQMLGRLTLNPKAHADPVGTILFPLIALLVPGMFLIGWAKPVPVTPANFGHPRRDDMLVSFAGPFMNFLLAILFYAVFFLMIHQGFFPEDSRYFPVFYGFVTFFMGINFLLAVFNLLPVAPLDGSWILKAFLPPKWAEALSQLDSYGMLIVLMLVFTGALRIWISFWAGAANGALSLLGLPPLM